jgi:hypothetical protein
MAYAMSGRWWNWILLACILPVGPQADLRPYRKAALVSFHTSMIPERVSEKRSAILQSMQAETHETFIPSDASAML